MKWIRYDTQKPKLLNPVLVTDGNTVDIGFFRENPPDTDICYCVKTGSRLRHITHWAEITLPEDSKPLVRRGLRSEAGIYDDYGWIE